MTLEVHNPVAFENAFRCRTVALTGTPMFVDYAKTLGDEKLSVISPDAGGMKRAELLREALEAALLRPVGKGLAEKHRSARRSVGRPVRRRCRRIDCADRRRSDQHRQHAAARRPAARKAGAKRVIALVTHGLFIPGAAEVIADPAIDQVVVTDAVPAFRLSAPDEREEAHDSARRAAAGRGDPPAARGA